MKVAVLVDSSGKILATAIHPHTDLTEARPTYGLVAGSDQTVYEIELPQPLERVKSAAELHQNLSEELVKLRDESTT